MAATRHAYRDHGALSDAGSLPYAPAPALQVIPTASIAGQFLHTCARELADAEIALRRVAYAAGRANAFNATDEQLEGLRQSARDCEMVLAEAIRQLCGEAA